MHRLRKHLARAAPVPGGRLFGPGDMRWVLLSLVAEQPGHGYELMTRLEARCGGAYQASAGTIYPTLAQLEDEGLVVAERREERKSFVVTRQGKAELEDHADDIASIWRRVAERSEWGFLRDPAGAEIIGPALRLAKAALKAVAKSHGDPDVVEAVRAALDDARMHIERLRKGRR